MMLYRVYSVFDEKVGAYLRPFFMRSTAEAVRAVLDEMQNTSSMLHRHPEDFTLFELGTFDELTGVVNGSDVLVSIGNLVSLKNVEV